MSATATPLARLAAAQPGLPGGDRWNAARRAALERLVALGLPTPRDDAWKYTNLRLLERRELAPPPPRALPADALAGLPPRSGPTFVFVDGRLESPLPAGGDTPGLAIASLAGTLGAGRAADIEARLGADDSVDERIRLLGASVLGEGVVLTVRAGQSLPAPLHLVHLGTAGGAYPRILLSLEAGAAARVIEYHLSAAEADCIAAPVLDVALAAGARLDHCSIGLAGPRAIQLEDVTVRVGRDAEYQHRLYALGAQLARLDLRVRLEGRGATARLAGLSLADRGREMHIRTRIDHVAPHTTSDQLYRGVANDRGRGSYDGKVVVHAGAMKSDSRQSSRNLLLSKHASIDTRPQLEINADDVKCSHGATTGALDESMLFYLLTRGLDRATARALLTFAFAEDVIAGIALPELRRHIEQRVLGSLPAADLIREFVG